MSADDEVQDLAREQLWLVTRPQATERGMSDEMIRGRVRSGRWQALQRGVYLVTPATPTWRQSELAACLFGGGSCVASHRGALRVFEADGFERAPLEVLVPMTERTAPRKVVAHRTRRLASEDVTAVGGIPVTTFERSLVDAGRYAQPLALEKALDFGIRRGLVTEARVAAFARDAIRIPGAERVVHVLGMRGAGAVTGSSAEVEFLAALRRARIEAPMRQYCVHLPSGREAFVDFAWPRWRAGVEVDGVETHAGRVPLESDVTRQNELFDLGWRLRRWTGTQVRRHPDGVAAAVARFLASARTESRL